MRRSAVRVAVVVAVLGAVLFGSGCSVDTEGKDFMDKAHAELMARPSSEEIVARYEAMQAEVRAAVTAAFPTVVWTPGREADWGGCQRPLDHTAGVSHTLRGWDAVGGIADADWPRAVAVVSAITARYGFTGGQVLVGRPRDHEVTYSDPWGGHFELGTGVNAIISLTTACHLPNSKR
jgi:hypothetical protein